MNVQIKMLLVVGFTFRLFFFAYSSTSALSLNINPIPPCIRSCCLPYLPGCLMHVDCWVRHHVIFTIIIIILLPVRRVLSVGRSVPSDFHVGECYCERQGRRGAKRKRWSCSRLDVEGNISRWGSVIENGERNDCISGLWLVVIKKTTTGFLSFCLPLSRAAGYSDYNIHSVWFNFMTLLIPQLMCLWHYGFTVWPGY